MKRLAATIMHGFAEIAFGASARNWKYPFIPQLLPLNGARHCVTTG